MAFSCSSSSTFRLSLPALVLVFLIFSAHASAERSLLTRSKDSKGLRRDISVFCAAQTLPFFWTTTFFNPPPPTGDIQRIAEFDYCQNRFPNIGTISGKTIETPLPEGGRQVVGSIKGRGVYAWAAWNDISFTNTTLPLLGAAQPVGDQLNETNLTPEEFNLVTARGNFSYVFSFNQSDVPVGAPLPNIFDVASNLDNFQGVAEGPLRRSIYLNIPTGTPGRVYVKQVSVIAPNPEDPPVYIAENVDIKILSVNPSLEARIQAIFARIPFITLGPLTTAEEQM